MSGREEEHKLVQLTKNCRKPCSLGCGVRYENQARLPDLHPQNVQSISLLHFPSLLAQLIKALDIDVGYFGDASLRTTKKHLVLLSKTASHYSDMIGWFGGRE